MTVSRQSWYDTRTGRVYYSRRDPHADKDVPASLPIPSFRPRQRRPHSIHITRFPEDYEFDRPAPEPRITSESQLDLAKLASRENAKRFFGLVLSPFSSSSTAPSSAERQPRSRSTERLARATTFPPRFSRSSTASSTSTNHNSGEAMAAAQVARTLQNLPGSRSTVSLSSTSSARHNPSTSTRVSANALQAISGDKPLASANGVSCSIVLAEQHIYVHGFDHVNGSHSGQSSTAMIRGKLVLDVAKSAKIKTITLSFCGKARTDWPEGIESYLFCVTHLLLILLRCTSGENEVF